MLTEKDVLTEKELLEKVVTMKRFDYSPLDESAFEKKANMIKMQAEVIKKKEYK